MRPGGICRGRACCIFEDLMAGPLVPGDGVPKPIRDLLTRARTSWLKNDQVYDIICNYREYNLMLATDPPKKPPGGTVYLFNRKAIRFFRKDGHNWRKKQGGKTVRETHEKLKVGNRDMLTCYYAHSEEKHALQRRCYWLLEGDDSIVFVHYLSSSLSHPAVPTYNAYPPPATDPQGFSGMTDLAQRHSRWRDAEDRVADPLQPIQIGVVVTTPADSFEHDPLPVTNSSDPLGSLDLAISPFSLPGNCIQDGTNSPPLCVKMERAGSENLARSNSASSARAVLVEGPNRLGYLHQPPVRQGSTVQTGETVDLYSGWESGALSGRVSSAHLDVPFGRMGFESRQPSMNRQSSNGVDVQSNLFGLSGRQDEPHVVVTLSEAPMQPLDDDDAGAGGPQCKHPMSLRHSSSFGRRVPRPGLRSSSGRSTRSSDGSLYGGLVQLSSTPPPTNT
eukprot:jgi/Botrbrau1/19699/Bobra.0003s0060.1